MKFIIVGITLFVLAFGLTANAQSPRLPTNILAIGDSHTEAAFFGPLPLEAPKDSWPEHLERRIANETEASPFFSNKGQRGYSTANMLTQFESLDLSSYDTAIIYGGANDTNAPKDIQSIENGTKVTLAIADQNRLGNNRYEQYSHVIIKNTVTGQSYERYLTGIGGRPTIRLHLSEPVPSIDDFSDYEIRIDTAKNLSHMVRILRANGVNRIAIVGAHLRAFSPKGEPYNCDTQEVTEIAIQASTRQLQQQAADDSGVIFVNTLDQNLGLVCSRPDLVPDPQALHRFGAEDTVDDARLPDSHLVPEGRRLFLADPIFSAMRQEGWL